MKVILLKDLKNLGKEGDVVTVAKGYARNYLLPKNLAEEATEGGIRQAEQQKKQEKDKMEKERQLALELADKLSKAQVEIGAKGGGTGEIVRFDNFKGHIPSLKKQHQVSIDKRKIEVKDPFKSIGDYEVTIKLAPGINARIRLIIKEG